MARQRHPAQSASGGEELDLHGMRAADAMTVFLRVYNQCVSAGCVPLRVIHGYGSSRGDGVIGREIRRCLAKHPGAAECIPGEEYFCNPGITLIYPKKKLPVR
ncbi:MAG: Smr/MutS family protein [Verrucomicrobiota bacterium]